MCTWGRIWESTVDERGQGSHHFPSDSPTSWHVHPTPPVSGGRVRGERFVELYYEPSIMRIPKKWGAIQVRKRCAYQRSDTKKSSNAATNGTK